MKQIFVKKSSTFLFYTLFIVVGLMLFSSCKKDDNRVALHTFTYNLDYIVPAGLNSTATHVFEFEKEPTFAKEIYATIGSQNVNSVKVSNARLIPVYGDSDLEHFRKLEVWVEPYGDPDRPYYDCAYTFDLLPRDISSYIQLIPSNQEFKEIYEDKFFNIYIRNYFYSIPNRTQKFRLILDISFYN